MDPLDILDRIETGQIAQEAADLRMVWAESDRLASEVQRVLDLPADQYSKERFQAAYQAEQAFNAKHHAALIERPGHTFIDV